MKAYRRELSVFAVLVGLLILVGFTAPRFFQVANLINLLVDNGPVLIIAIGMTAVILCREIDISVGSIYAIATYTGGLLAKHGVPPVALIILTPLIGGLMGALNGWLVVGLKIPSMIATLATMTALRGALLWATQGEWIHNLPANFQWLGLGQTAGQIAIVLIALVAFAAGAYALVKVSAGRALYAVGSDRDAATLVGLRPPRIVFWTFVFMGVMCGLAAFLQAIRFHDVQPGVGVGMEMQVIACVVVGGTSITGGKGNLWGTLIGVALLGVIGTMLTFESMNAAWARAIQGAIILVSVVADAAGNQNSAKAALPAANSPKPGSTGQKLKESPKGGK